MAFLAGKHICISGGGIGGSAFALALEQACKLNGIDPMPRISIFERDPGASTQENLGWSFSLKAEKGLGGLQVFTILVHSSSCPCIRLNLVMPEQTMRRLERGILAELEQLQEPGSSAHICWQTPYNSLLASSVEQAQNMDSMRIMRSYVRKVLLSHVPPEAVHFGRSCVSAMPAGKPGEPVQMTLADGTTEQCDLLVVADGANSKLRTALLPQETNQYTGICMLLGRTQRLDERDLPQGLWVGPHLILSRASTTLFMGLVDKNTVLWCLSTKDPESRAAELRSLFKDPTAAQEFMNTELPKLAAGFGEPLQSMIQATRVSSLTAFSAVDKMPHPNTGENGIVYIGDAWHPMSPFSGNGANMALQDAWELAQQLVNGSHPTAQAAITEFAKKAAPRCVEAINKSHTIIGLAHSDGLLKLMLVAALSVVGLLMRLLGRLKQLDWRTAWSYPSSILSGRQQKSSAGVSGKQD